MAEQQTQQPHVSYLDNLRVGLTMLVVAHHAAIAFGGAGDWYYMLPQQESMIAPIALTLFTAVNQAFFMSLFFFLAAYFTPASCDKKGVKGFILGRLIRLGLPLLVYYLVLNLSVIYLVRVFRDGAAESYGSFFRQHVFSYMGTGPLWFLLTLLLFSVAYGLGRGIVSKPIVRTLPGNRGIVAFVLAVGLFTFLIRMLCPAGQEVLGLKLGYFPLYISMFSFGVLACRGAWLEQLARNQANRWFIVSLILIAAVPVVLILGGALDGSVEVFMGGWTWQAAFYAFWEPVLCVGISMKLLVFFRDRLNNSTALSRSAAKSAYTVYILHPFVVVTATWAVSHVQLDRLLQFLLICPVTILCCFLVSEGVRRLPGCSRVL